MCDKDTCNDASCCGECEPWNCLEQQINDALATKEDQLQGYVDEAKDAAAESKASAEASAQSAAESKEFRDEAETAASTAVAAEGVVLGVANTLQDTADKLEQVADELNTAIAGIAVSSWFYTTVSENQTVIPVPANKNAVDVQSIYTEGSRQSPFRGFEFDKTAMTITLAEPLPLGLEIEIILGTYNSDNPNDFAHTLASDNGASLIGTTSGNTVQQEITNFSINTREQWRRSLAEAGLTLVDGSFEEGASVQNDKQAVWHISGGQCYVWGGVFPKTVPVNSTPLTTGGVAEGAWVSVGDAVLRGDLAKTTGATMVGAASGRTVQEELTRLTGLPFLFPELYLVGGETDHTAAFKQMAEDARTLGKHMVATGSYTLTASTDPVNLYTPFDFSGATITCSTVEVESGDVWSRRSTLLNIPQSGTDVTPQFTAGMLSKGAIKVAVSGLEGALIMTSSELYMKRNNGGVVSDVLKQEVNQIDSAGFLKYRNYVTYSATPTVTYKPFMPDMTGKLPRFILNGARISNLVMCSRNNVTLTGGSVSVVNLGEARQFIELNECARVVVDGLQVSPVDAAAQGGGYLVEMVRCSEITFRNVTSISSNFGGIDGGAFRDVTVDRCDVYEIAGHYLISDYQVLNSTFRWRCSGQGWGVFRIKNCIQFVPESNTTSRSLTTRDDYMSSWDGTFEVDGLRVVFSSVQPGYYCVSCPEPKYDGQFMGYAPNVTIRNVEIDNSLGNSMTNIRILDMGVSPNLQYEQFQRLPQYHDIEDVRMVGDLSYNGITTNVIFNGRNYAFLTSAQRNAIARGPYRINVRNVDLRRCGRGQDVGSPRYNVYAFAFTTYGVKQLVEIDNSYNCMPLLNSLNGMEVNVRNQVMCFGVQDPVAASRTFNSDNRVRFFSCSIYSPDWLVTESPYRSAILHYHDCYFGWRSYLSETTEAYAEVMGAKIKNSLGKVANCAIYMPTNSFQQVDSTFQGYVTNGFTSSGIYKTS